MWGRIRAEVASASFQSGTGLVSWAVMCSDSVSHLLTTARRCWRPKSFPDLWRISQNELFAAAADGCHQLGLQMWHKVIFLYFSCFRCLNVTIQDHILQYMSLGEQTSLTFYSLIKLLYTQRLSVSVASCSALFSSFSPTVCWAARVETLRLNPSGAAATPLLVLS